jgi:hypothetical protein
VVGAESEFSAIWPRAWVGDQITVSDQRRSAPGARVLPFGAAGSSWPIIGEGTPDQVDLRCDVVQIHERAGTSPRVQRMPGTAVRLTRGACCGYGGEVSRSGHRRPPGHARQKHRS